MKKTFTFHTRSRLWILCAAVCMVWAVPLHAQTRRISLNLKNATIQQAVIALQQQGYSLSVKADDVDMKAPVDIHARNEELQAVVDRIFAGQDVNCIINDKSILITKVPSQPSSEDSPQESSVTGQVKGPNGLPLVGVTVLIDGTMVGTTTDASGNFRIRAKSGDTLVFSYIGYDERREKVGVRTEIDVTLAESSTLVNEVVVIGYGTQSRRTLSTAISKVSGEVFDNAPAATVGDALKGRVAGLHVQTSNAIAGESPRMMIRGGSSITMGNDPIYIVDGALREDLTGINTNDIESMEVLKDAASASIYGARASNGVILVTTKKGSFAKGPQIVFDLQLGCSSPSRKWDFMNAREYISFLRPVISKAYANGIEHNAKTMLSGPNAYGTGNTAPNANYSTRYLDYGQPVPAGYQWMYDPLDANKVIIFTDTDWQSQWFTDAFWHKEYIGVNGGTDKLKYAASVSYHGDDGMVAMSSYKVFTLHGSTSFKITKNLEASTTFDLSRQKKHPLIDNYYQAIGRGIIAAPTAREFDDNGDWCQLSSNGNAHSAGWYESFYDREQAINRASGTFGLKWNITDGLTAFAQYNYFDNSYRGSYYAYGERNGTPNNVSLERNTTETREQTIRDIFTAHLNYNKTFRDVHTLNVTGGYEYMSQNYWKVKANAKGASSDDVPVLGSGSIFTASNQDEKQAMISYFARASYNYDDRYIVSGTFRADGSSKFAVGNQWGYFPAGSVAWVISEEPFWRNAKKTANTFKLRASYGQTGNNGIGLYDAYGAFATGTYHGHTTLLPSAMANSALKWETTTQLDLGMDLGFFGDRLRFVFDYYNKHTDNMLFSISVPDTGPYSSVKANVGSARFYGVEVELSSANIRREHFSWTTDITYSFTRNKVLSLPGEYAYDEIDADGRATGRRAYRIGGYKASESGYRFGGTAVGEPLGRIYGYKIDHIIQTEAEADAALYDEQSNGYRVGDGRMVKGRKDAGDYEWRNRKGSARRDGEEIINDEDQFYLGNVMPHSTGGINNTFRYKRLSLNVYCDFALGHSIINGMKAHLLRNTMGNCNSTIGRIAYDCWQHPGDTDAKYARFFPNDSDWGNRNWRQSNFMVEKADYLCLRDVSLYYDLPEHWLRKIGIRKVTVGVTGNTLCYWTGVTGAISPESGIGSNAGAGMYTPVSTSNSNSDITANMMPVPRKIIFSLKLVF